MNLWHGVHSRNREGLFHTVTAMKDHAWTAHRKGKRSVLKFDSFGKLIASLEGRHVVQILRVESHSEFREDGLTDDEG